DAAALRRSTSQRRAAGNAADVIEGNAARRSINIYSSPNAPVVAVNDGIVRKLGESRRLGKFIVLQDSYGNRYTYSPPGQRAKPPRVPREQKLPASDFKLPPPAGARPPSAPASAGDNSAAPRRLAKAANSSAPRNTEGDSRRLYALPERPANA